MAFPVRQFAGSAPGGERGEATTRREFSKQEIVVHELAPHGIELISNGVVAVGADKGLSYEAISPRGVICGADISRRPPGHMPEFAEEARAEMI